MNTALKEFLREEIYDPRSQYAIEKKLDINEYAELTAKRIFWNQPRDTYSRGLIMGVAIALANEYQLDKDFVYTQLLPLVERYWELMRTAFEDELISYKPDENE